MKKKEKPRFVKRWVLRWKTVNSWLMDEGPIWTDRIQRAKHFPTIQQARKAKRDLESRNREVVVEERTVDRFPDQGPVKPRSAARKPRTVQHST